LICWENFLLRYQSHTLSPGCLDLVGSVLATSQEDRVLSLLLSLLSPSVKTRIYASAHWFGPFPDSPHSPLRSPAASSVVDGHFLRAPLGRFRHAKHMGSFAGAFLFGSGRFSPEGCFEAAGYTRFTRIAVYLLGRYLLGGGGMPG